MRPAPSKNKTVHCTFDSEARRNWVYLGIWGAGGVRIHSFIKGERESPSELHIKELLLPLGSQIDINEQWCSTCSKEDDNSNKFSMFQGFQNVPPCSNLLSSPSLPYYSTDPLSPNWITAIFDTNHTGQNIADFVPFSLFLMCVMKQWERGHIPLG